MYIPEIIPVIKIVVVDLGKQVIPGNIHSPHRIQKIGKLVLVGEQAQCQPSGIQKRLQRRKHDSLRHRTRHPFQRGEHMQVGITLIHHAKNLPDKILHPLVGRQANRHAQRSRTQDIRRNFRFLYLPFPRLPIVVLRHVRAFIML